MGAGRKAETFNVATGNRSSARYGHNPIAARNLGEDQLGGVIFGCKHNTIKECLSKQLFGLPSGHFIYVKNVKPGMPLFLFNYSDRKMHGIFEAACAGQLNIDRFAWSDNGRIKTQFPAQVRISTRTHCLPVPESQFKNVISANYHKFQHFYFELDHAQMRALISLFKPAPVHDFPKNWSPSSSLQTSTAKSYLVPGQVNSESYPKDFNQFVISSDSHNMDLCKLVGLDGEYASASRTSKINLDEESSNRDDLDDAATKEGIESTNDGMNSVHEEQSDKVAVRQKLQELFVTQQKVAQSSGNAIGFASNKSTPLEVHSGATLPTYVPGSTSKGATSLKDLTSLGQCYGNAELLHIIDELSKRTGAMEKKQISRKVLSEGRFLDPASKYDDKKRFPFCSCLGRRYAVGGHDGNNLASTVEIYDSRANLWRTGSPFSVARGYGCAVTMGDNLYLIGGINDAGETVETVEVFF